jgi:uncharacterized membrane protein YfhO
MERLKNWKNDNRFIILSFFTSMALMLLVYLCFGAQPFGDVTVLRMDLYHQYGPLFAEFYDILTTKSSIIYSWESGGGGGFLGNYYNYLSSPMSFLILLFGHKGMPRAISFFILLKASAASATMGYYFKHSVEFRKQNAVTAAFSVAYAFCGYFVAYYWNVMWLGAMIMLPLIVFGIEKIINDGHIALYSASLAIAVFSNYFMVYMLSIFSVLYFLTYYFGKHKFGTKVDEEFITDKKLRNRLLHNVFWKFAGGSVLAAGLTSISLLPVYCILQNSSATKDVFPTEYQTYFNFFDFLSSSLAGLDPTIRSSGDDVLPNIYCGIATVILVMLYFLTKSISLREKLSRFCLLTVLYLSFNINSLNFIWHGFHSPNDLPYRFSYMYSFVLITLAVKAIIRIRELQPRDVIACGAGVAFFIIILEKLRDEGMASDKVSDSTIIISLIFTVVYVILLTLFQNKKYQVSAVAALLFCCMITETAVSDTPNFAMDQTNESYTSDYSSFRKVKEKLDSMTSEKFYRMETTTSMVKMNPSWYGYNGISVFSSMASEKLANLQYDLGIAGNYINSYTYNPQTPVYNMMFGLEYLVNNTSASELTDDYYKELFYYEKYTAYKNKYCLPLAFCVNDSIKNWNYAASDPFSVQSDWLEKASGASNVFTQLPITDISYSNINEFSEDLKDGTFVYYKTQSDAGASVTFTVTPSKTQHMYLYVRSDDVSQITVSDGDQYYRSQAINEPYIFDMGVFKAGTPVQITVPFDGTSESGYVTFYCEGINDDVFREGYEKLTDGKMNITSFDDTDIKGTFTADDSQILYTSITYDPSWEVFIDGVRVSDADIIKVGDALLGVKVSKGRHNIEFRYVAQGMVQGAIISGITIIVCIFYIRSEVKKAKTSKVPAEVSDPPRKD